MQVSVFLSFVLPLVACLPAVLKNDEGVSALESREHLTPVNLAQFNFAPFLLRDLVVACVSEDADADYSCTLKFNWEDANFNTSTSCSGAWDWNSSEGTGSIEKGNVICNETAEQAWQYNMVALPKLDNFTITMSHKVPDAIHFPTTQLAQLFSFNSEILLSSPVSKTETAIVYEEPGPVACIINAMDI